MLLCGIIVYLSVFDFEMFLIYRTSSLISMALKQNPPSGLLSYILLRAYTNIERDAYWTQIANAHSTSLY